MAKMRYFAIALVALLFSACATTTTTPPPEPIKISDDELKLVLIKSKNIRFYDFGTLSIIGVSVANPANLAKLNNPIDSGNTRDLEDLGDSADLDDSGDLVDSEDLGDTNDLADSGNLANASASNNPNISNAPITSQSPSNLRIELRVFKLGKFLGSFVVTKSEICYTDFDKIDDCAPKWVAARSFFGNVSYGELFEDIFQKKDIFDGQGKRIGADGAEIQEFSYGGEKFYYERSQKRIYFKNLSNGVIVSIEDYKK